MLTIMARAIGRSRELATSEDDPSANLPAGTERELCADDQPESAEDVREALARLPPQDRSLIEQLFWQERSETEAGAMLGIGRRAVCKRKHVILRALRARL